jgi:hypothetical protein
MLPWRRGLSSPPRASPLPSRSLPARWRPAGRRAAQGGRAGSMQDHRPCGVAGLPPGAMPGERRQPLSASAEALDLASHLPECACTGRAAAAASRLRSKGQWTWYGCRQARADAAPPNAAPYFSPAQTRLPHAAQILPKPALKTPTNRWPTPPRPTAPHPPAPPPTDPTHPPTHPPTPHFSPPFLSPNPHPQKRK